MYYDCFGDWGDVLSQFNADESLYGLDKVVPVFAVYTQEHYEGSAAVIFVQDGKFWFVSGSHCSCFGLEDQWGPEEMPLEALNQLVDTGATYYWGGYEKEVKASLETILSMDLDGLDEKQVQFVLKLALQ